MIKKFNEFIAENYVGVNADATMKRQRKQRTAVEMEQRGYTPDTIRMATGWFRNLHDHEWRYEHNSNVIRFRSPLHIAEKGKYVKGGDREHAIYIPLVDLIENTSLFREYPKLKEITVALFLNKHPNSIDVQGFYSNKNNMIGAFGINIRNMKDLIEDKETIQNLDKWYYGSDLVRNRAKYQQRIDKLEANPNELITLTDKLKSTILHELQHAIQYIEGFAVGGSPSEFEEKTVDRREMRRRLYFEKKLREHPDLKKAYDTNGDDYVELVRKYDALPPIEKFGNKPDMVTLSPDDQYYLLAGEIEARDVQKRIGLPKKSTYKVNRKQSIKDMISGIFDEGEKKPEETLATFDTLKDADKFISEHPERDQLVVRSSDSKAKNSPLSGAGFYRHEDVIRKHKK
jgi:predicted SprT family Zn-dependent metalloprotease